MGETTTTVTDADSRGDIYQRVTDRIIAAIEAGVGEWRMPWHSGADGAAPALPVNALSKKSYRGINSAP
jgi:antirestriction protein ArdC